MRLNENDDDEIEQFQNMRSLGALEACSRIFSLQQSERYPAVQQLTVHLPLQQQILFDEGEEVQAVADALRHKTHLTEFFEYNRLHPATSTRYCDFPERFLWSPQQRNWKARMVKNGTIGRVYTVHPSAGEKFYLRMLLHHDFCKGEFIGNP